MADSLSRQRLLIGLGSFQGDDQVGWQLAEQLGHQTGLPFRLAAVPADLLQWLPGTGEVFLYDAAQSERPPGTLLRWEWPLATGTLTILDDLRLNDFMLRSTSSHHIGLPAVLELAQKLGMLPQRVVLHAIVGKNFAPGQPLSDELQQKLPEILNKLADELCHA